MSFTNQMLGALGTATGALAAGKHIAEQRQQKAIQEEQKAIQEEQKSIQEEQKAISSFGQLQTAIDQEAEAKKMNEDALAEQMKFEKANPNLSDEDALNQEEIEKLKEQDEELSKKMFEKHPRNEQGRFISQMEHQSKVAKQQSKVNQDLEMAKKARDEIDSKLAVRYQLKQAVETRATQLRVAKDNKILAENIFEKNKKYLPKGGNN